MKDASAGQADASFAEITARRRGRLRRYLYQHPRVMDAVVVLCYTVLVAPTMVDAVLHGAWLAAALLAAVAPCAVLPPLLSGGAGGVRCGDGGGRHPPPPVGIQRLRRAVVLAVRRGRGAHPRFALVAMAAATAPLALLYLLAAVGPGEASVRQLAGNPGEFQLLTSIAAGTTIALSNVIATGIGISVRQRREHEQEIAAWASRTASLGSVNERNRIAREMHDVVAHSLTVMVSLSDGAAVVVRKDPDRAAEVLAELSRTGRTALADMRRVLGVLRDDAAAGQAPREPLAAGDSLAKLLEGFRTAGLPLHYSHTGPALPGDAAFQLTVYRIVQESLTNVLRYGRALGRVDVSIVRDRSTVTIEVVDDGTGLEARRRPTPAHRDRQRLGSGQGLDGDGGAGPDLRRHRGGRADRSARLAGAGSPELATAMTIRS